MLITGVQSDDAQMNEASDEGESNTHESRTTPSPRLQLLQHPSNAGSSMVKMLDGLGYLNHNADNLLGYLKTVSTHLIPST